MKKEYDFSKAKKNPYIQDLKKQVTIRLDAHTLNYFKNLAEDNSIPYQTLIASVLHKYVTGRLSEKPAHSRTQARKVMSKRSATKTH